MIGKYAMSKLVRSTTKKPEVVETLQEKKYSMSKILMKSR